MTKLHSFKLKFAYRLRVVEYSLRQNSGDTDLPAKTSVSLQPGGGGWGIDD
jgi:hypothetical protein